MIDLETSQLAGIVAGASASLRLHQGEVRELRDLLDNAVVERDLADRHLNEARCALIEHIERVQA